MGSGGVCPPPTTTITCRCSRSPIGAALLPTRADECHLAVPDQFVHGWTRGVLPDEGEHHWYVDVGEGNGREVIVVLRRHGLAEYCYAEAATGEVDHGVRSAGLE